VGGQLGDLDHDTPAILVIMATAGVSRAWDLSH
jgi:hypothetical protein